MIDERSGVLIPDDFATLVPIERLIPASWNPNKQNDKVFNSLVENIQLTGFDEAIEVVPLDDEHEEMREKYLTEEQRASGELYYLIVGGHHRWEAGRILDMKVVPVVRKHAYDEDMTKFQNVRKNMLKGKIDPYKFTQLYEEMTAKYGEELVKEQMALLDEKELARMVVQTAENLPPEMKKKLEEAKEEIRNVDDLSRILNELFSKHGDTLEYSYMCFDFGGKTHLWVQMNRELKDNVEDIKSFCYNNQLDINEAFGVLLAGAQERLDENKDILTKQSVEEVDFS